MSSDSDILEALRAGGFVREGEAVVLQPLTGGVSSTVVRVDVRAGRLCVKQALAKLRVAADWRAPVERSHYEVEWLRTARPFAGDAVPEVLFEDRTASVFVMRLFEPATHPVWKTELAEGRVDPTVAARLGALLAAVHAGCSGSDEIAARFPTTALFEDLRLDPFLRHSARSHPDLAARLVALADRTAASRISLVHGDVSPKNILCGPAGPVLLDAECAWYGDPAFDLAFCSAHLLLKCVWKPAHTAAYLQAFRALSGAYLPAATWEPAADLEGRAAELTAAILLARVDGKSPADYLKSDADRGFVRAAARDLLAATPATMTGLAVDWAERLAERRARS